jgi:hypothetical protein
MKTSMVSIGSVALWAALAGNANAQCGSGAGRQAHLSPLLSLSETLTLAARTTFSAEATEAPADDSIVGLWDVKFQQLSPGPPAFFDEGYDQFHSDGTEILNDIPDPASGNVCLGLFVQTGLRSYKLHHVFWSFDATGNVIGRGTWDSDITLDKSGASYTGNWTMKNYNLSGILLPPVLSGTLSARRISVQ